ncbi:L,D-transpeptidase family protein [Rubritalea marina]|uniref:L,D-transpeptidase family protein n=1 Tax=Rubritalea marina TaxID=361055 RepID=UPI000376E3A2|nr:L,D-transpeptidase family protein [Rubritalea marina]
MKVKNLLFCSLIIGLLCSSPALRAEDRQHNPDSFTWNPELSTHGPVLITVSLKNQIAAVYRNGIQIGSSEVSTGFDGHETPTGVFHILNKDADHHSKTYGNASMPYSERLTWGGVALHAGAVPGYRSSHGCIHLPYAFSKKLFGVTHRGTTVVVSNESPDVHVSNGHKVLLSNGEASKFIWQPELAPSGPVSLIFSRKDKKLYLVRNGVTIGECKVKTSLFGKHTKGTAAFIFSGWSADHDGGRHSMWTQVSGSREQHTEALDEWFKLDPNFQHILQGALTPGTNLVVTEGSVKKPTGKGFPLLQGAKEEAEAKSDAK